MTPLAILLLAVIASTTLGGAVKKF